jgi:hypothetical protein
VTGHSCAGHHSCAGYLGPGARDPEPAPPPPYLFWKYVIRRDFKSFVLEVCVPKGVTDAFLRIYVNLKELKAVTCDL